MGVALATQHFMNARRVDIILAHTRRHINYLAVAISTLFIKVSGQMLDDKFKRLGFSFLVTVLA